MYFTEILSKYIWIWLLSQCGFFMLFLFLLVETLMRFYYASYSLHSFHWDESVERKVWFPSVVYCMLSLCRQDEDQNCANFAKYPCSCSARLLTTKTLLWAPKKEEREAKMSNVRRRTDTHRISLHRWDDGNMEQISHIMTCIPNKIEVLTKKKQIHSHQKSKN